MDHTKQTKYCKTYVKAKEYSFEWVINNSTFSVSEFIESPVFQLGFNDEFEFQLKLCISAICEGEGEPCSEMYVCLNIVQPKPPAVVVEQDVRFLLYLITPMIGETIIYSKVLHSNDYGETEFVHEFIKNEHQYFTIVSKIIYEDSVIHCFPDAATDLLIIDQKSYDDYEKLLEDEQFGDVTLAVGDKKFHVYRGILAARSSVFSAMFKHEMKEEAEKLVKITDVDPAVMKEILRFIYANKVNDISTIESDLLVAADKYDLEKLKLICEEKLMSKINEENAVELLIIADRHSAFRLRQKATKFIASFAPEILQTEKFKNDMKSLSRSFGEICLEIFAEMKKA